jgi:signal transduction histidine kinase
MQNLNTIFNKLLPMLQADALKNEHVIIVELEEIPNFELNEQEIRQVILNLARNGFESMAAGGVITIKTYLENDQAVIAVSDQGSGIPPEVLKNIGKPFLTTKDNGTGLGLAVSYNIVHRHGGTIYIETGSEGTTFVIKLPLQRTPES